MPAKGMPSRHMSYFGRRGHMRVIYILNDAEAGGGPVRPRSPSRGLTQVTSLKYGVLQRTTVFKYRLNNVPGS